MDVVEELCSKPHPESYDTGFDSRGNGVEGLCPKLHTQSYQCRTHLLSFESPNFKVREVFQSLSLM